MAKLPPAALEVLLGSPPEIMRRALATLDARYGGPVAAAKARLGLTDDKIARIRRLYLW